MIDGFTRTRTNIAKFWCTRTKFKRKLLAIVCINVAFALFFLSGSVECGSWPWPFSSQSLTRMCSPPLSASDSETLRLLEMSLVKNSRPDSKLNPVAKDSTEILGALSDLIQNQLSRIQNSTECLNGGYTLRCGHNRAYGFGCQIHHRVACVALSYSMGIPLIHDLETAWPFSDPWEEAFLPLGSTHCPVNNKTIHVEWQWKGPPILQSFGDAAKNENEKLNKNQQYECVLKKGIPVSKKLGQLLKQHAKHPFLWLIGQFVKYTMKLSSKQQKFVDDAKKDMGIFRSETSGPFAVAGFQVRRTDKTTESKDSAHEIDVYMKEADKFFQKGIQIQSSDTNKNVNMNRSVFIASEDHTVLLEARELMKSNPSFLSSTASALWNVVGVESGETQKNQRERRSHLRDIVRDVVILSDCDYVVCGYSSNICRLVLEILSYKDFESFSSQGHSTRLKSLDGKYKYFLEGFIMPSKLILVDTEEN